MAKVTNHRLDHVSFKFNIDPTTTMGPNYHLPLGRELKLRLGPRESVHIMEVDKIDPTRDFQP